MKRHALFLAALLITSSACFAAEPTSGTPVPIPSITKPSQDVTISFTHPGLVVELLVKQGDYVKKGAIVAKQDATEEQALYDISIAQAKDETRVTAQETVRDQKEKTYIRKKESKAASAAELDEALLDWKVGIANVILSKFEHAQDGLKAKKDEATLEKTRLYSPIEGRVEQTIIKAGENVDNQNMKVMRIVNIDPLWIEVPVPYALAVNLKNNDTATVIRSNKEQRTGKIIDIATVADSASDTLLVRIEVPNAAKTPAGERVSVSFPADGKVAASANDH